MAVVGQHRKLKAEIFNHRQIEENCKWGQRINSQIPTPVMYFLPQDSSYKGSIISTNNWESSFQIAKPMGTFLIQTAAM